MYYVSIKKKKYLNNIFIKTCNKFKKNYLDNYIKTEIYSSISKLRNIIVNFTI